MGILDVFKSKPKDLTDQADDLAGSAHDPRQNLADRAQSAQKAVADTANDDTDKLPRLEATINRN